MAVRSRYQGARSVPFPPAAGPAVAPSIGFPFRLLLVLGVLPFLLLASVLVVYREQQTDRIYSGVTVFGVSLGRMTQAEASDAIKRRLQVETRQSFLLRYDDDAFSTSLAALGVGVDDGEIAALAERAWSAGRDAQFGDWLRSQLVLVTRGYAVPTALQFNRDQAVAVLGRAAVEVDRPTFNASFTVEKAGEGFEIHTSPAKTGRRLNVDATLDQLQSALVNDIPHGLDLVLDEAPPGIGDADIQPAIDTVKLMLGSPLVLKDGGRSWSLDPQVMYGMLEIRGLDSGRPPISAQLNDAKLRDFVQKTAKAADLPARNPTFDVQGDQVVIRKGTPGKLADPDATFELARAAAVTPDHTVDLVFKEDQPWLAEADLEPSRTQANTLLDLPITLETPALPGIQDHKWVLDRALLSQMLVLPDTQAAPRDYAKLPPAQRPRFDIQLDSGKVTNFLAREVAPWVSEDPVDAAIELKSSQVDVPNPAYTAALAAQQGRPAPGQSGNAPAPSLAGIPPTVKETRYAVEMQNSRDGRGPDYLGTFAGLQILFRSGATVADPADRRVAVRLAARPPRVQDKDLARARDMANFLIGEPIVVRWESASWTVSRAELAAMLRYQTGRDGMTAYLTRDGLIAKASAIAQDAERRPDAPVDEAGRPRKVDVPETAAAIWQQASTVATDRVAGLVWLDEPPPASA